ncbi:MAG TPA: 50S ribosomal protein L18, partial [archaeon]|nr:50S ribosomal protein L18 [archaeon]
MPTSLVCSYVMRLKIVPHRRRREGKTNYRKRLDLLKSRKVRFVVRKSSKNIYCQLVEYQKAGDKTLLSSNSQELRKFGWNAECGNLPAAYLTGLLCGLKAKEKKISDVVLDTGLYRSVNGSRIYAALKGALDSGLDVKHSEE